MSIKNTTLDNLPSTLDKNLHSKSTYFLKLTRQLKSQRHSRSRPRVLLRMYRRDIKSSGEPWSKNISDWFQQKTIKVFLIGPFKFVLEQLNAVRRVWRGSGFFPRNVEVNTTGRFLISAIPKQHLYD